MNDEQRALKAHIPFTMLARCDDCDECFNLRNRACPACGSGRFTNVARWIADTAQERTKRAVIQ